MGVLKNIIITAIIFCFIACSKKEATDIPDDIPQWLQVKIADIKKEQHGELYVVSEYRIDGATFYNINRPVMSCLICELYDIKGVRANVALSAETDIKKVRVLWPKTP